MRKSDPRLSSDDAVDKVKGTEGEAAAVKQEGGRGYDDAEADEPAGRPEKLDRDNEGKIWTVSPNLNLILLELTPFAKQSLCKGCNKQIHPATYRISITQAASGHKKRGPPTGEQRKWHIPCYEDEYSLLNPDRLRLFFPSANYLDDTALELAANWCRVRNGLPPLTRDEMAYAAWGDDAASHDEWWKEERCFIYTADIHLSSHGENIVARSMELNDVDIGKVDRRESLTELLERMDDVPKRFSPGHPLRKLMPVAVSSLGYLKLAGVQIFDQWHNKRSTTTAAA